MPEAFANPIKDEITRHNCLLSWLRMQQSVGKILGIVVMSVCLSVHIKNLNNL